MSVNLLDVIILIPLLLWARQGYNKGFIISVASFAALVLGLYVAFFFSDYTARTLKEYFNISQEYLAIISFVVTFVIVVLVVVITGNILDRFVDVLMLGFLNKMAGLVFGILKGALYLSILFFVINFFDPGKHLIKQKHRDNSLLYYSVESIAPMLYARLNLETLKIELPDRDELIEEVY